jgi:hypothetical protein
MSQVEKFTKLLGEHFAVATDVDVLVTWRVSYCEMARYLAEGLPKVGIEFPLGLRGLSFPESLYLMQIRYPNARVLVRSMQDQAAAEVMLLRGKDH